MSGPKVVRIVTREEVEAICRQHLAIVEDAAGELRRCAKRRDVLNDPLIEHLDARIQELRRLFEEDRLIELQKQAPSTVAFLKAETQRIQAEAIAAAEAARSKRRRVADAARTIMAAMEAAGLQPSPALRAISTQTNLTDEAELLKMQGVLNENYAALTAHRNKPTASQNSLTWRVVWRATNEFRVCPNGLPRRRQPPRRPTAVWTRSWRKSKRLTKRRSSDPFGTAPL
jgi:hypothetical protein